MRMTLEPATLVGVHSRLACQGQPCTVHNLSVHKFRTCPQVFNNADGRVYRVCPHLNFHIDPDEYLGAPEGYRAPVCCN